MAAGDFTLFEEFALSLAEGKIDLETDTIKMALIVGASGGGVDPAAGDATPQWGAGSGVDYDGNDVVATGNYTAGGLTLSGPVVTEVGGVATFDDDGSNLSIAQDAVNGFTNAYWGILYSDTATNKDCIGFLDLGGPVSEQAGPITINFNGSGILTVSTP